MVEKTNIYLAIVSHTQTNLSSPWHDKDLHVFVPDESNLNKSMEIFFNLNEMRTRKNREYWLLDSTFLNVEEDPSKTILNDLPNLDLDDDIYMFEEDDEGEIKLWEYYEIHPTIPRKLLPYGNWNDNGGLSITEKFKWIRRRNLEGVKLIGQQFPSVHSKLIPKQDKPGEWDIFGKYADRWSDLQVSKMIDTYSEFTTLHVNN